MRLILIKKRMCSWRFSRRPSHHCLLNRPDFNRSRRSRYRSSSLGNLKTAISSHVLNDRPVSIASSNNMGCISGFLVNAVAQRRTPLPVSERLAGSHRHDISECPAPVSRGRVKECRDIYVTDEMVALVYQCASPVIQDAIDLACPTAQRPAESLRCDGITSRMVRSGLSKERPKQDYRLILSGSLPLSLTASSRAVFVGMTLLSDPKGQRLKHSGDFRRQFKLARDCA